MACCSPRRAPGRHFPEAASEASEAFGPRHYPPLTHGIDVYSSVYDRTVFLHSSALGCHAAHETHSTTRACCRAVARPRTALIPSPEATSIPPVLVFHPSLTGRYAKGIPWEPPGVGLVSSFTLGMIIAACTLDVSCLRPVETRL